MMKKCIATPPWNNKASTCSFLTEARIRKTFSFSLAPLLVVIAGSVMAQQIEEIVVTAQKREQNLQDVALTVQVFDGATVARQGIFDIENLSENMPAVIVSRTGNSQRIIIRGVGSGTNNGFEQSVGTFVDGIYMGRGRHLRPKFFDLGRIEVLKGPQSILFGNNVTAGAFNITTNNPTDDLEGQVSLLVGEQGELDTSLIISGPVSDKLTARAALYGSEFDGYVSNTTVGDAVAEESNWGGRIVILYEATEKLTVRAAYEHQDLSALGNVGQVTYDPVAAPVLAPITGDPGEFDYVATGGLLSGYSAISNGQIVDDNTFDTVSLNLGYEGGNYSVTSITGYTQYDWHNIADVDFLAANLVSQDTDQSFDQISQEFRLESSVGDSFDYLVGAYYQSQNLDQFIIVELPGLGVVTRSPAEQETTSWSVFGEGIFHINDQLHLTLGARWGSVYKEVTDKLLFNNPAFEGLFGAYNHNVEDSRDDQPFSWLIRPEYDLNADILLYASASRGFKSGGFDINGLGGSKGTVPEPDFEFDEERATNFELGAKMNLLDNSAALSLGVFNTTYEDLQVTQFTGIAFNVGNAAKATVKGLELDYRQALTDHWMVSATATWQDFTFDSYPGAPCTARQRQGLDDGCDPENGTQDLSGETGQFAPEFSANLNLDYTAPVSRSLIFSGNLNVIYSDDYYTALGLDPNHLQNSYTKLNIRIALATADNKWEVAILGKNLTDEKVSVNSFDHPFYPLAYVKFITRPRSFGMQATYRY